MERYSVVLSPSATRTRLLVTDGADELSRSYLPPPSQVRHERAMPTLLEGLAMLLDARLHVVLSVDAQQAGFCLGLTDELGAGLQSLYYGVRVVGRRVRRRRGSRIRTVGNFADLRQLRLLTDEGALW